MRALGPIAVLIAGCGMLAWTWGAWPDPLVDFGREAYVAWRLAEGDALAKAMPPCLASLETSGL